jgi:hypothetical protein
LANFVGCVVGFLKVCKIRLVASSLPSRYPLTGCATKERAIKRELFTITGSDAKQAAASMRNGITPDVSHTFYTRKTHDLTRDIILRLNN